MKCVRCSAEIPSQSQYCLRCGTPISAATTAPIAQPGFTPAAPPASGNKSLTAIIAVLVIAVLALGAFMVKGMLAQKPEKDDSSGLVRAPKKQKPSGLVEKPAENRPSPVVEKPAEGTPPPPAEIVDYLAFLKQVEENRKKMERLQASKFQAVIATFSAEQLKGVMKDMDRESPQKSNAAPPPLPSRNEIVGPWDQIATQFRSKTPPASCLALHDAYFDFIGKAQMQILQVFDALSRAQSDQQGALSSLFAMQGDKSVDEPMHKADQSLADVCDKYHIRKEFDIGEGSAMSTMFH